MRTDTRPILIDSNGFYLSEVEIAKGFSICEFCSRQIDCPIQTNKPLKRCEFFTPVLSFSGNAVKGLDGVFSTFRSSVIWYKRAKYVLDNDLAVGLVDLSTGDFIGFGVITYVYFGGFSELMKSHAHTNHLCKAENIDREKAQVWLPKQIRNLAGSRYIKENGTVIYVEVTERKRAFSKAP